MGNQDSGISKSRDQTGAFVAFGIYCFQHMWSDLVPLNLLMKQFPNRVPSALDADPPAIPHQGPWALGVTHCHLQIRRGLSQGCPRTDKPGPCKASK